MPGRNTLRIRTAKPILASISLVIAVVIGHASNAGAYPSATPARAVTQFRNLSPELQERLLPLFEAAGVKAENLRPVGWRKGCESVLSIAGRRPYLDSASTELAAAPPEIRHLIDEIVLSGRDPVTAFFDGLAAYPDLKAGASAQGLITSVPRYLRPNRFFLQDFSRAEEILVKRPGAAELLRGFDLLIEDRPARRREGAGFGLRAHVRRHKESTVVLEVDDWRLNGDSMEAAVAEFAFAAATHYDLLASETMFRQEVNILVYNLKKLVRMSHPHWRAGVVNLIERLQPTTEADWRDPLTKGRVFQEYLNVKADLILLYQYRLHLLWRTWATAYRERVEFPVPFRIQFKSGERGLNHLSELHDVIESLLGRKGYFQPLRNRDGDAVLFEKTAGRLSPEVLFSYPWFAVREGQPDLRPAVFMMHQVLSDMRYMNQVAPTVFRLSYAPKLAFYSTRIEPLYHRGHDLPVANSWNDPLRPDRIVFAALVTDAEAYLPRRGRSLLPEEELILMEWSDYRQHSDIMRESSVLGAEIVALDTPPDEDYWLLKDPTLRPNLKAERAALAAEERMRRSIGSDASDADQGSNAAINSSNAAAAAAYIPPPPPPDMSGP